MKGCIYLPFLGGCSRTPFLWHYVQIRIFNIIPPFIIHEGVLISAFFGGVLAHPIFYGIVSRFAFST